MNTSIFTVIGFMTFLYFVVDLLFRFFERYSIKDKYGDFWCYSKGVFVSESGKRYNGLGYWDNHKLRLTEKLYKKGKVVRPLLFILPLYLSMIINGNKVKLVKIKEEKSRR